MMIILQTQHQSWAESISNDNSAILLLATIKVANIMISRILSIIEKLKGTRMDKF